MGLERTEQRSFTVALKCNYLLWKPEEVTGRTVQVIASHDPPESGAIFA